jgi:hypothetical protein
MTVTATLPRARRVGWVHHNDHGPTHVRTWYPPFCVVADVVIGLPLLAGWVL